MSKQGTLILDHGYIKLIEHWGSDEGIVESARMSTSKGFLGWDAGQCPTCAGSGLFTMKHRITQQLVDVACSNCSGKGTHMGDSKLLKYLWDNKHCTPFEFAGATFEIQAPIFVFREWHRHRTQSYSEMSSRYTPLPNLNYIPSIKRLMESAGTDSRQTKGMGAKLTQDNAEIYRAKLISHYEHDQELYEGALALGVSKELARIHLPVGRYSRMRASTNLRNWLAFMTLRLDQRAQQEIREYAEAAGAFLAGKFPRTWNLFKVGL